MNSSSRRLTLAVASLTLAIGTANAGPSLCDAIAGNLILNCGFELGPASSHNATNWTASGNPSSTVASGGFNSGILSYAFNGSNTVSNLAQTFADVNGATYQFTFYVFNTSPTQSPELFQASWNGTQVLSNSGGLPTSWTQETFSVIGTGSDTITFSGFNNPGLWALDDVSVVATTSATPEPSAVILLGTGFVAMFGLLAFKRRRLVARVSTARSIQN